MRKLALKSSMAARILLWRLVVIWTALVLRCKALSSPPRGTTPTLRSPFSSVRLLILPGFGNEDQDYFLQQAPQGSLVESLKKRGWSDAQIEVLPLRRTDWLQVFLRGALDLDFWLAKSPPYKPAFAWYLQRIADCINKSTSNDDEKVVLVCHSAGGWLARAALGYASRDEATFEVNLNRILGVVTLGTPHLPPPPEIMDMTRGALRLTHETFPGAFYSDLFYISVIGNAIRGDKQERKNLLEPTTATGFAHSSYEAVCGDGTEVGDGVVPVCAGHLEGATQITLDGVFHSINAPDQWYGSDAVLDSWHDVMLQSIDCRLRTLSASSSSDNPLQSLFRW